MSHEAPAVSLLARRHGVNPGSVFTWRSLAAHGAFIAAAAGEEVVPTSGYRALEEQLRELHRPPARTRRC